MGHVTVVGGCRAKAPLIAGGLPIGSVVKLMEGGTAVEYLVVNHGIPSNSSLYDASCDGTWLLRKDCHSSRQWDASNVNDYANSTINTWLNGDFFNSLDSVEQATIKQVKIPYRAGSGYGKTVSSGANGLRVKIFLLSFTETNLIQGQEPTNEGTCLSYFSGTVQNGNDTKRVAYLNGAAIYWWLRSPRCYSSTASRNALSVKSDGGWVSNACSTSYGIRPALVLPSNALFDGKTMLLKGVA